MKKILVSTLLLILSLTLLAQDEVVTAKIVNSQIEVTYTIQKGMHQTLQKEYFYIETDEIEGITFEPTIYPDGKKDKDGHIEYYDEVTLIKKFTIADNFKGEAKIKVYAGYQLCYDAGSCLFPEEVEFELPISDNVQVSQESIEKTSSQKSASDSNFNELKSLLDDFTIIGKSAGYQKPKDFIVFLDESQNSSGVNSNPFADKSIWLVIILILVGGIALNLTPCVLPMMPITIAVLGAGTQSESKARGFLVGSFYGLGMALAYGLLGIIVILTGSQFGTLNSSPWFNLIIAIVFILLALAMFDIIAIDFTKFQKGASQGKNRGKFITVFIMGIIAAILAGACVAPVLIAVILYSTSLYTSGNPAGLLLPFLLGVGMAIPWPFAGAGLSVLPKPGNWMKWIKIIFGIIILIIALYYGYLGVELLSSKPADLDKVELTHGSSNLPWLHSFKEAIEKSKAENKPIFIDFWATWCKNCLVMDATTFKDEAVEKKLKTDYILLKYQAEKPKEHPTKEILDYFKSLGLPTYIVMEPK
ncbi:MAG TPA: DUF255 domain-containing protein [Candidatus Cloacimonetes bacterium]|nr:DUF255 domain-containing protein [Candidatus Cloacimonadota bacterium]